MYHLATLHPVKIDAQTGKDYFSFEQNKELFDVAAALTKQTGITVAHATRRNKAFYAAPITNNFLDKCHPYQLLPIFLIGTT